MKWCWACREDKPLTDFHSDRTTKDGRAYTCRQCFKERWRRALRLTEAQKRCLASVAAGTVYMHFDVYGGYSWSEGDNSTRAQKTPLHAPRPLARLTNLGLIELGRAERPFSGCQITPYVLTPTGRAALDAEGER